MRLYIVDMKALYTYMTALPFLAARAPQPGYRCGVPGRRALGLRALGRRCRAVARLRRFPAAEERLRRADLKKHGERVFAQNTVKCTESTPNTRLYAGVQPKVDSQTRTADMLKLLLQHLVT